MIIRILLTLLIGIFGGILGGALGFGQTMVVWQLSVVIALFTYVNTWNQTLIPSLNMFFYRKAFVNLTLLSLLLYLFSSISLYFS